MKKIILTGGGSAGHVTPNLALVPYLRDAGYEVHYVGGKTGLERELVESAGLLFHPISTGKLRRGKFWRPQNVTDMFKAVAGIGDSLKVIKRVGPDVIFSKGGFVGLPVAAAAWFKRVPLILHESDLTSGLANRMGIGFAKAVCVSFPETMANLPARKAFLTGNPIRRELLEGNAALGREFCGFTVRKPTVLFTGGSQGAEKINTTLAAALPKLLPSFNIIHLCGRGKMDEGLKQPGYAVFEYINEEMRHVLNAADVIVSRAGSNSLNEFLALRKPSLLIPLSRATRGDQIENAKSFVRQGFSMMLEEGGLTPETLTESLTELYRRRDEFSANMAKSPLTNAAEEVMKVIKKINTKEV